MKSRFSTWLVISVGLVLVGILAHRIVDLLGNPLATQIPEVVMRNFVLVEPVRVSNLTANSDSHSLSLLDQHDFAAGKMVRLDERNDVQRLSGKEFGAFSVCMQERDGDSPAIRIIPYGSPSCWRLGQRKQVSQNLYPKFQRYLNIISWNSADVFDVKVNSARPVISNQIFNAHISPSSIDKRFVHYGGLSSHYFGLCLSGFGLSGQMPFLLVNGIKLILHLVDHSIGASEAIYHSLTLGAHNSPLRPINTRLSGGYDQECEGDRAFRQEFQAVCYFGKSQTAPVQPRKTANTGGSQAASNQDAQPQTRFVDLKRLRLGLAMAAICYLVVIVCMFYLLVIHPRNCNTKTLDRE